MHLNHQHAEIQTLQLQTHLGMTDIQFTAAAHNPIHPCYFLTNHPPMSRNKKHTPGSHINHLYNQIPLPPTNTSKTKGINMHITHQTWNSHLPKTILNLPSQDKSFLIYSTQTYVSCYITTRIHKIDPI